MVGGAATHLQPAASANNPKLAYKRRWATPAKLVHKCGAKGQSAAPTHTTQADTSDSSGADACRTPEAQC
ncbi:hypothetical protein GCM10010149_43490 [Nonomuraea roseoviolacea subsp. roseoviolacea]